MFLLFGGMFRVVYAVRMQKRLPSGASRIYCGRRTVCRNRILCLRKRPEYRDCHGKPFRFRISCRRARNERRTCGYDEESFHAQDAEGRNARYAYCNVFSARTRRGDKKGERSDENARRGQRIKPENLLQSVFSAVRNATRKHFGYVVAVGGNARIFA